jgi:hypothetical protein
VAAIVFRAALFFSRASNTELTSAHHASHSKFRGKSGSPPVAKDLAFFAKGRTE